MTGSRRVGAAGFSLVELMVVVLIMGILVTLAMPVYVRATASAERKSCQSNQRVIMEAVEVSNSIVGSPVYSSAGRFAAGGSGWYGILVPEWVKAKPTCPADDADYYLDESGTLTGDNGSSQAFKPGHQMGR